MNAAYGLGTLNCQMKGYSGYHSFTKETRLHWATYLHQQPKQPRMVGN